MSFSKPSIKSIQSYCAFLIIPIVLMSCKEDSIDPDENGFFDQVAQGRIDGETWVHEEGFAQFYSDEYSQEPPVILVFLTMEPSSHSCQKENMKEFYVHFSVENEIGLRDLYLDGFGSPYQVGIIGATDRTQATTLLNIGKIDITSISSDSISGRIHGLNTTFTDTFVNGTFSVPFCEDPS